MARIPPELVDHIIDFLHDNHPALRNCSLVCHEWTPSSHFHLFYSLQVKEDWEKSNLIHLLESAPSIASYVHDFHFSYSSRRLDEVTAPSICKHLNQVTELTLMGGTGRVSPDFTEVLTCFPALKSLSMKNVYASSSRELAIPLSLPKSLQDLEMHECTHASEVLNWFAAVDMFPQMRSLRYSDGGYYKQDLMAIRNFCSAHASHLVHLHFEELEFKNPEQLFEILDKLTNLQTFTFKLLQPSYDIERSNNSWSLHDIPTLFQRITSPEVTNLTFDVLLNCYPEYHNEAFDRIFPAIWVTVAEILKKPQYQHLVELSLVVDQCVYTDRPSYFKPLEEMGILNLDCLMD